MKAPLRIALVAALAVLSALALAADVSGKWKGHVSIDVSKLPKASNAQEQAQIDQVIKMIKAVKMDLTVNKNKTYSMVVNGGPQKHVETAGVWKLEGSTFTLEPQKRNGKATPGGHPQPYTLAKNGRAMSGTFQGATVTFNR
jgi:hypothetical protein